MTVNMERIVLGLVVHSIGVTWLTFVFGKENKTEADLLISMFFFAPIFQLMIGWVVHGFEFGIPFAVSQGFCFCFFLFFVLTPRLFSHHSAGQRLRIRFSSELYKSNAICRGWKPHFCGNSVCVLVDDKHGEQDAQTANERGPIDQGNLSQSHESRIADAFGGDCRIDE
jgi:hypothetical protein